MADTITTISTREGTAILTAHHVDGTLHWVTISYGGGDPEYGDHKTSLTLRADTAREFADALDWQLSTFSPQAPRVPFGDGEVIDVYYEPRPEGGPRFIVDYASNTGGAMGLKFCLALTEDEAITLDDALTDCLGLRDLDG